MRGRSVAFPLQRTRTCQIVATPMENMGALIDFIHVKDVRAEFATIPRRAISASHCLRSGFARPRRVFECFDLSIVHSPCFVLLVVTSVIITVASMRSVGNRNSDGYVCVQNRCRSNRRLRTAMRPREQVTTIAVADYFYLGTVQTKPRICAILGMCVDQFSTHGSNLYHPDRCPRR